MTLIKSVNMYFRYVHTADALRLLLINKYGGFYADSDFVILKSLKSMKNVIASDQVTALLIIAIISLLGMPSKKKVHMEGNLPYRGGRGFHQIPNKI